MRRQSRIKIPTVRRSNSYHTLFRNKRFLLIEKLQRNAFICHTLGKQNLTWNFLYYFMLQHFSNSKSMAKFEAFLLSFSWSIKPTISDEWIDEVCTQWLKFKKKHFLIIAQLQILILFCIHTTVQHSWKIFHYRSDQNCRGNIIFLTIVFFLDVAGRYNMKCINHVMRSSRKIPFVSIKMTKTATLGTILVFCDNS